MTEAQRKKKLERAKAYKAAHREEINRKQRERRTRLCQFNDFVKCSPDYNSAHCDKCGWNPAVVERRKTKMSLPDVPQNTGQGTESKPN